MSPSIANCDRCETPLERGTPPDEIADGIRFILEARSLTGQMIAPDGGQHLGWLHPAPDEPVRG